jgi:hypothetical protein
LAVPRFTNGKRERLVLVNWLLTTTTSLARVMNVSFRQGCARPILMAKTDALVSHFSIYPVGARASTTQ